MSSVPASRETCAQPWGDPFQDLVALFQRCRRQLGRPAGISLSGRREGASGQVIVPGPGGRYRVKDLLTNPVGADVGYRINPEIPVGFGKLDAVENFFEFHRGVPIVIGRG